MEARGSRPSPVEGASSSDRVVWARYIGRNRNIFSKRRQAPFETRRDHGAGFTKRKVMRSDSPTAALFARSLSPQPGIKGRFRQFRCLSRLALGSPNPKRGVV